MSVPGGRVWAAETEGLIEANTHSSMGGAGGQTWVLWNSQDVYRRIENLEDRQTAEVTVRKAPNARDCMTRF